MFEIIKKSVLAGIGAVAMTEEKAQEIIDDFVQKGKLSQQEGKTLINELQQVIQENKEKLITTVDERVKCIMNELNLLTKDDLAELEENIKKELTKVDRRLAKIEKQIKANQSD